MQPISNAITAMTNRAYTQISINCHYFPMKYATAHIGGSGGGGMTQLFSGSQIDSYEHKQYGQLNCDKWPSKMVNEVFLCDSFFFFSVQRK